MTKTTTALLLSLSAVAGCLDEVPSDVELSETESPIYTLTESVWPTREIPVCFEIALHGPSISGSATSRADVREAVEGSWERVANIDFTGWGYCLNNQGGIRIAFRDVNPHVKALGTGIDGMVEGMVLNDTYANWDTACQAMKSTCNRIIAVHEFGHALGFAHEHNRDDRDANCTKAHQGTDGDSYTTSYDPESVMNYCAYSTDKLSMLDVIGVQRIYGTKPARSLIAHGGKCVASYALNGELVIDGCEDRAEHRWTYSPSLTHMISGIAGLSRCAAASASAITGAQCATTDAQRLTFAGVQIRGYGDRCIGLPSFLYGDSQHGTNIEAEACGSNARQKWTYMTSREMKNWYSNLCLSVEGGQAVRGAKVEVAACNGSAVQKWTFAGGRLRSDASVSQCVRFHTGTGDTILYDCDALTSDRDFRLAGPISRGGMCFQLNGSSNDNQTLVLATCNAENVRQIFDYRF